MGAPLDDEDFEILDEDGSVVLTGILKLVTESMLQSYPRSVLGKWTPNRARIRYTAEEAAGRDWKNYATGETVDVDGALMLSRPPKGIEPPPFSELELSATSATKAYSVAAPGGNGGGE